MNDVLDREWREKVTPLQGTYADFPDEVKVIVQAGGYQTAIMDAWYILTHIESYQHSLNLPREDVVKMAESRLRGALEAFGKIERKEVE